MGTYYKKYMNKIGFPPIFVWVLTYSLPGSETGFSLVVVGLVPQNVPSVGPHQMVWVRLERGGGDTHATALL